MTEDSSGLLGSASERLQFTEKGTKVTFDRGYGFVFPEGGTLSVMDNGNLLISGDFRVMHMNDPGVLDDGLNIRPGAHEGEVAECRTCGALITWDDAHQLWAHRDGDPRHPGTPGKFVKQQLQESDVVVASPNDGYIDFWNAPLRFNAFNAWGGSVLPLQEILDALSRYGIDLFQSDQPLPSGWTLRDRGTNMILGSARTLRAIELLLERLRIIEVPPTCAAPCKEG